MWIHTDRAQRRPNPINIKSGNPKPHFKGGEEMISSLTATSRSWFVFTRAAPEEGMSNMNYSMIPKPAELGMLLLEQRLGICEFGKHQVKGGGLGVSGTIILSTASTITASLLPRGLPTKLSCLHFFNFFFFTSSLQVSVMRAKALS